MRSRRPSVLRIAWYARNLRTRRPQPRLRSSHVPILTDFFDERKIHRRQNDARFRRSAASHRLGRARSDRRTFPRKKRGCRPRLGARRIVTGRRSRFGRQHRLAISLRGAREAARNFRPRSRKHQRHTRSRYSHRRGRGPARHRFEARTKRSARRRRRGRRLRRAVGCRSFRRSHRRELAHATPLRAARKSCAVRRNAARARGHRLRQGGRRAFGACAVTP